MNGIWKEFEEHYKKFSIDPKDILKDGIVDDNEFRKTRPRILFVLKEINKWPSSNLKGILYKSPWPTIAYCTLGILNRFPEYSDLGSVDLRAYTSKVAVICLKKKKGKRLSEISVISAYAHQDRNLLREQVYTMDPNLIIAVNTVNELIWLLDLQVNPETLYTDPIRFENGWVIPLKHFSETNIKEAYEELEGLMAKIRTGK